MDGIDIAFVASTVGVFLLFATPLGRLCGLYGPTRLVEGGWVLGVFGRPTARFWALSVLQFGIAAAYNFVQGNPVIGAFWSVTAAGNVWLTWHEHRKAGARDGSP